MKFYYLGNFGKYSTETYMADALSAIGHNVKRVQITNELTARQIIHDSCDSDVLLFGKLTSVRGAKELIANAKPLTVCWVCDVYPWQGRDWFDVHFLADVVITTGSGNHHVVRQGIPENQKKIIRSNVKTQDVLFVGSLHYKDRINLDVFLKQTYGEKYRLVGEKDEARGDDLTVLLSKTKIVVGDSVPQNNYWSNRIYEITGRGGFIIHPYVQGIETEWSIGKNLVTYPYGDYEKLKNQIDYYLSNDDEREKIREAQFKNCPTYTQRAKELVAVIEKNYAKRKR